MTLRIEQIFTVFAACVITSINGECIDAPSYRGTLNVTLGGYTCQRWDSQQPQQHTRNISGHFPNDASVKDAHNYCRDADGSYELWCYTTDTEKRWENCVNESDICSEGADYEKCQTLPENKNSTHCPNDTSVYLCVLLEESIYLIKNILYHFECDNYVCCPTLPATTHHSVTTFLSSTDSPGQNETSTACCHSTLTGLLNSTVKNQTPYSGRVEGSKLDATASAEITTPYSSGNVCICSYYLFPFVLLMVLLSCSYLFQN